MGIESYDYTVYYVYNESCEVIGFKYKYLDYANYPNWVTENYSYVKNLQGDIVGIINDATGEQVVSYTYDAWGNITSTTGTLASTIGQYNSMRYRGYYYDTDTGMYYLQSRYYNPEMRRFINADEPELLQLLSLNSTLGGNIFTYCDNLPIINYDFNGFWYEKYHNFRLVAKKGFTVNVSVKFLSRTYCLSYANDFLKYNYSSKNFWGKKYYGMNALRIAQELWFHALAYYIGKPIQSILKSLNLSFEWLNDKVRRANPIDINNDDTRTKWFSTVWWCGLAVKLYVCNKIKGFKYLGYIIL